MKKLLLIVSVFFLIATALSLRCGKRKIYEFVNPATGTVVTRPKTNMSDYAELPWVLPIFKELPSENTSDKVSAFQCGGSMIHPQVVITSAKCLMDKDAKYHIRGFEVAVTGDDLVVYRDRFATKVLAHPEYNPEANLNNVALLILEAPFLRFNTKSVCLLPAEANLKSSECFSTVWREKGNERVNLETRSLPVIEKDVCEQQLRKTYLGNEYNLDESLTCSESNDFCESAEGNPLLCPIPGRPNNYYQAGIVSLDFECNTTNSPIVYTNVAKYRQWIDDEMKNLNFDISSFTS